MTLGDFLLPPPGFKTSDALVAVWWLASNGLLVAAAWRGARTIFPRDSLLEMLAHTIVLCWGAIVFAAFALSLLDYLSGQTLLLAVGCMAVLLLTALRYLRSTHPAVSLFGGAETAWLTIWGALLVFALVHLTYNGLLTFPKDWDSLTYHIPLVVQWLHVHNLYAPDALYWSNPGNNELLGLWFVGVFSGDFLIGLNNLPSVVLLGCSVVALGRELILPRALAHLIGLAVISNYVVFRQLTNSENDVAAASLFIATILFTVRFMRSARMADLAMCSISLGLLAGVKFYAIGYAGLVGASFVLITGRVFGPRRGLVSALILLIGAIVFGGYWYMRNIWATGEPFYPKAFLSKNDALSQVYPDVASTTFLGNRSPELPWLAAKALWTKAGPCYFAAVLLVPLSCLWLFASRWSTHLQANKRSVRVMLALLLGGAMLLLLVTPFAVEDSPGTLNQIHLQYCPIRYGMCLLSLAVMALGLVMYDLSIMLASIDRSERQLTATGLSYLPHVLLTMGVGFQLVFSAATAVYQVDNCLLILADLLLFVIALRLTFPYWTFQARRLSFIATFAIMAGTAYGIDKISQRWHDGFVAYYDSRVTQNQLRHVMHRAPAEANIAMLAWRGYPFFGPARQFRVYQPFYAPSPRWLLSYFREKDVAFVVYCLDSEPSPAWQSFEKLETLCPDVIEPLEGKSGVVAARIRLR